MFQKTAKTTTNAGEILPANVPQIGQNARADNALATKLALEVPRTSNLSEFPLRVAFARYALSASAGRRANTGEKTPANVPQNGNAQSRRRQTELKQSNVNLPCLRQSRRRQTELALEVPRTSNLSKLGELKKPKAIFICFRLG
ncbi:hypothetical protein [Gardnerella sp. KA00747]|uniref:hypothetical protein n=1 Tax=Gardnerella sp. KA00747 TaxID=2749078 RepID=UPI003BAC1585